MVAYSDLSEADQKVEVLQEAYRVVERLNGSISGHDGIPKHIVDDFFKYAFEEGVSKEEAKDLLMDLSSRIRKFSYETVRCLNFPDRFKQKGMLVGGMS